MQEKAVKRTLDLYILMCAFEYFISILVSGTFLATLTSHLGISDSLTGIITSFVSLGCLFQLLSMFLNRRHTKNLVLVGGIVNQLIFMLLYVVPFFDAGQQINSAIFIVVMLVAYILSNAIIPIRVNWFYSLLDPHQRGVFSSKTQIVSLITGMLFTFGMGTLVDHFRETGQIKIAFILCAVTIFVCSVAYTLMVIFSVPPAPEHASSSRRDILRVFKSKNALKITLLFCIWRVATYSSLPFYSTYQIKELGFSLQFVSFLNIVHSLSASFVSTPWGKFADKKGFAIMMRICLGIAAAAFLVNVFTVPKNGAFMYLLYTLVYATAVGGIGLCQTNLVFEMVEPDLRSNAVALNSAISGLVGFLVTLIVSPLVDYIQQNGNQLFGLNVYAQQMVSLIACIFTVLCILYITFVIRPKKRTV